ncbi:hypothetical protein [Actinocatenispora rupis]|uniref:Adhesin n=1 Tax=Actinocatenispora rupis TaxID=519421 RepID=A0A8J3NDM0_9ACTN|nr:hypothetical protein [Actinocatenispora rupis]GID15454.1 hypothetical protein Aru02nite_63430 [Actinocatenispora rupis]
MPDATRPTSGGGASSARSGDGWPTLPDAGDEPTAARPVTPRSPDTPTDPDAAPPGTVPDAARSRPVGAGPDPGAEGGPARTPSDVDGGPAGGPDGEPGGTGARAGFVGAFVRTVGREQGGRAGAKVAVGALVVVLALAVVVVSGALLSRPRSRPTTAADQQTARPTSGAPSAAPSRTRGAPPARTGGEGAAQPATRSSAHPTARTKDASRHPGEYQAVAAPGCASDGATYTEHGRYSDGESGWYTVGSGGWTGAGCPGSFTDVPMSGDAEKDDPTAYVVWGFRVPAGARSCRVEMYVPTSSRWRDVASARAHYRIQAGTTPDSPTLQQVDVDQVHNEGSWQVAGSYRVSTGVIGIRLLNRGIDYNDHAHTYAHLAASAARVTCGQ